MKGNRMPTRLTYSESNHSYWLADGKGKRRRVPAVSALKKTLHQFDNDTWKAGQIANAAIDDWERINDLPPTARAQAIKEAGLRRLAEAREFGTAVHHYAESLWTGEPVEVPDDYLAHVTAIADWWTGERITLRHAEALCWADEGDFGETPMAGRLDLIVNHPDRGVGLLDLKTWRAGSAGGAYTDEWAFQLAGYSQMEHIVIDGEDQPFPVLQWRGVLHVGPSGADLYTLPQSSLDLASDRVAAARSLKAIKKPTMSKEQAA